MESNNLAKPIEILLVEDNLADIELTKEALSDGHVTNHLHVVRDGVDALDFLHRRGAYQDAVVPDLVLLDLNLPKKNGRDVLREIKDDQELKRIPVIILTTSKADEDILKSYELHANSYITKPVDFDQFVDVVRSIEEFWLTVVRLPSGSNLP